MGLGLAEDLLPQSDRGEVMGQSKNIQKPYHHGNDDNGIQNRLYRSRHGNESVDEPEQNTNHDQNQGNLY
jgi:hypothetical protein